MNPKEFRISLSLAFTLLLMAGLFLLLGAHGTATAAPPAAPPTAPLFPEDIVDVEWERVYSGTLDGVTYSGLYWGGAGNSRVALADLDDDGDLDALLGSGGPGRNYLHFFRNTGTAAAPISLTGIRTVVSFGILRIAS